MNILSYAANCEKNFELNMANVGYERKTTFTSDLSIAEWCEVKMSDKDAVKKTIEGAKKEYIYDAVYISELIMSVNMKAWEHEYYSRNGGVFTKEEHEELSKFYSDCYYELKDYVIGRLSEEGENDEVCEIYNIID